MGVEMVVTVSPYFPISLPESVPLRSKNELKSQYNNFYFNTMVMKALPLMGIKT